MIGVASSQVAIFHEIFIFNLFFLLGFLVLYLLPPIISGQVCFKNLIPSTESNKLMRNL